VSARKHLRSGEVGGATGGGPRRGPPGGYPSKLVVGVFSEVKSVLSAVKEYELAPFTLLRFIADSSPSIRWRVERAKNEEGGIQERTAGLLFASGRGK
jgi:hypothetical protein